MRNKLTYIIFILSAHLTLSQANPYDMNDQNNTTYENTKRLTALEAADKIKWELTAIAGGALFLGIKELELGK